MQKYVQDSIQTYFKCLFLTLIITAIITTTLGTMTPHDFKLVDGDNNRVITPQELQFWFATRFPPALVDQLINDMLIRDSNRDGNLSLGELENHPPATLSTSGPVETNYNDYPSPPPTPHPSPASPLTTINPSSNTPPTITHGTILPNVGVSNLQPVYQPGQIQPNHQPLQPPQTQPPNRITMEHSQPIVEPGLTIIDHARPIFRVQNQINESNHEVSDNHQSSSWRSQKLKKLDNVDNTNTPQLEEKSIASDNDTTQLSHNDNDSSEIKTLYFPSGGFSTIGRTGQMGGHLARDRLLNGSSYEPCRPGPNNRDRSNMNRCNQQGRRHEALENTSSFRGQDLKSRLRQPNRTPQTLTSSRTSFRGQTLNFKGNGSNQKHKQGYSLAPNSMLPLFPHGSGSTTRRYRRRTDH